MSELPINGELLFFTGLILLVLFLFLLAGREKIPEELLEGGLSGGLKIPFTKAAIFLWKRIKGKKRRRRKSNDTEERLCPYGLIIRVRTVLIFLLVGAAMGALVTVSEESSGRVVDGRRIRRDGYGGSGQDITVKAVPAKEGQTENGTEEDYGSYVVHVSPRVYTEEETNSLAEQAMEEIPALLAGSNPDLEHVSSRLSFVSSIKEYPFSITWENKDYRRIDSIGNVTVDDLEEGESVKTAVKATLRYNGRQYSQWFPVILTAAARTTQEEQEKRIAEELEKSDRIQAEQEELLLPDEVDGIKVVWEEERENTGLLIFLLVAGAGGANLLLASRQEQKKREQRRKKLEITYPQVVNRMVLYLGAGMSVRNIFFRLGSDYEQKKSRGEKEPAGEEILKVCHELEAGTSEATAYGRFGQRCGIRSYIRLSALLVQNLRKGNRELLQALQEEAIGAEEARKQLARQLGEEAGTKMLLPMMMMLAVTMIVIIVPAFLGFL